MKYPNPVTLRKSTVALAAIVLIVLGLRDSTVEGQPRRAFKVVVNSDNPSPALPRATIARMFLLRIATWDHGPPVVPVDQLATVAAREAFTGEVHGRSVASIKSYWERMIFSGRGVPPPEVATDREVLDFIRSRPGAIGYVSSSTALGSDVKELEIAD